MSRSTDTLRTATTNDYKRMASNGSIESVDKSVLSTETSYDVYDQKQKQQYSNEYAEQLKSQLGYSESNGAPSEYIPSANNGTSPAKTKVYGLPEYSSHGGSIALELAFRNEGFRDTSTTYSGVTRNNSLSTAINEESPIIHAPGGGEEEIEETGSDYYGNSSTLPMRVQDKLSFLNELKQHLPEYEPPTTSVSHSSFQPARNSQTESLSSVPGATSYASQRSPPARPAPPVIPPPVGHVYQQPSIQVRRPAPPEPEQMRRPDSYMKAVKKYATPGRERDSILPPPRSDSQRPKTLYESSGEQQPAVSPIMDPSPTMPSGTRANYARSKSEALLETNFDGTGAPPPMLSADSRSYSQPLETAM
uniref:Uncharacterized protein n=1 Tax=Anopheles maculatus TaxID=74869 RepID=A0A182T483_9DIPT